MTKIYKVDEKLALAKELGLKSVESWLKAQEEFEQLTSLKFTPATRGEIRRRIVRTVGKHPLVLLRAFLNNNGVGDLALFCLFFGLVGGVVGAGAGFVVTRELDRLWVLGGLLSGLVSAFTCALKTTSISVSDVPLALWEEDLPYGALLAAKEATERGMTSLTVWYPQVYAKDPILSATTKHGATVILFEWDDKTLRSA